MCRSTLWGHGGGEHAAHEVVVLYVCEFMVLTERPLLLYVKIYLNMVESGNRKDLKCVIRRRRRRRPSSVSIDSHVQYISFSLLFTYCRTMMAFQRTKRRQWGGVWGGFPPPSKDI